MIRPENLENVRISFIQDVSIQNQPVLKLVGSIEWREIWIECWSYISDFFSIEANWNGFPY